MYKPGIYLSTNLSPGIYSCAHLSLGIQILGYFKTENWKKLPETDKIYDFFPENIWTKTEKVVAEKVLSF